MADNKHRGQTLDAFLEEQGDLAECRAKAIEEVIAWQIACVRPAQSEPSGR